MKLKVCWWLGLDVSWMMEMLFLALISSLSIGMMAARHPLSLGSSLILLSLSVAGEVASSFSSWLAMLVVLVYVGGMLVMFMYVCCLAPNCLFGSGILLWVALLWFLVVWLLGKGYCSIVGVTWNEMLEISGSESAVFLFSECCFHGVLCLGSVLFMVMVGVVKLCRVDMGPLRPF